MKDNFQKTPKISHYKGFTHRPQIQTLVDIFQTFPFSHIHFICKLFYVLAKDLTIYHNDIMETLWQADRQLSRQRGYSQKLCLDHNSVRNWHSKLPCSFLVISRSAVHQNHNSTWSHF